MQPVALQANSELYSTEYEEIAKTLEEDVANGRMTASEAQAVQNKTFSMYMNPYGTITTGSPLEKMVTIGAIQTGNTDKPSYYTKNYLSLGDEILSWGAGDSLNENILSDKLIGDATYYRNRNRNADKDKQATTNDVEEQLKLYREKVGLADNYNTNTQKLNTALLNATTDIAEIKSIITDKGWAIGEMIVKGITTYIGAKIIAGTIGKSLGLMGGTAAGGTGAGILASAGGIALGTIGGVAAILGISTAISDAKFGKVDAKANKELYDANSPLAGNTAATKMLSMSKLDNSIDWENGNPIGNVFGTLGKTLGEGGRWVGSAFTGTEGDNEGYFKNFRAALDMSDNSRDEEYRKTMTLAWWLLADYGNGGSRLSDIGISHSDFINYLKDASSPSVYEAVKHIGESPLYGWRPKDAGGNRVDSLSDAYINNLREEVGEGFHRYGLDKVPYDNYIAHLHEGEAVLTSSTANELRNLLTEYRANNQSAINLDVAIQNQTVELVNKLEEVVVAIRTSTSGGGMTSTSTLDQTNAIQKLQYSMTHLVSTKSALN